MGTPTTASRPTIDARLVSHFVSAARHVFTSMLRVEPTVGKPHLKADPSAEYDVSGVIGFIGEVTGSVVLSFQRTAAEKFASAFAGVAITAGHPDFADAIGELANMIAGSAKKHFGGMSSITVPSVIVGAGHHLARLNDVPTIVVPFSTPSGDFRLEVNVKQSKNAMSPEER